MLSPDILNCESCGNFFADFDSFQDGDICPSATHLDLDEGSRPRIKLFKMPKLRIEVQKLSPDKYKRISPADNTDKGEEREMPLQVEKQVIKLDELEPSEMLKLLEEMDTKNAKKKKTSARLSSSTESDIPEEGIRVKAATPSSSCSSGDRLIPSSSKRVSVRDQRDDSTCLSKDSADAEYSPSEEEEEEESEDNSDSSSESSYLSTTKTTSRTRKRKFANNNIDKKSSISTFYCRICKINFTSSKALSKHMKSNHLDKTKQTYKCPHCSHEWKLLKHFHRHLDRLDRSQNPEAVKVTNNRVKSPRKPKPADLILYRCEHCERAFKTSRAYQLHKEVQDNAKAAGEKVLPCCKKLKCPLCKMGFKERTSLTRHFVCHLENHPYTCKFPGCGQRLTRLFVFKKHVATHVQRKHFICDICEGTFASQSGLKHHKLVFHSNEAGEKASTLKKKYCNGTGTNRHYKIKSVSGNLPEKDEELNNPNVKTEPEDFLRVEVGSVHFGNEDYEEEEMEMEVSDQISEPNQNEPTDVEEALMERESLPDLYKLILRDPVFIKLKAEDPSTSLLIVPEKLQKGLLRRKITKTIKCAEDNCDWVGVNMSFYRKHLKTKHYIDASQHPEELPNTQRHEESLTIDDDDEIASLVTCAQCGKKVAPQFLAEHVKIIHQLWKKGTAGMCPICKGIYASKTSLRWHLKTIHEKIWNEKIHGKPKVTTLKRDIEDDNVILGI